MFSPGDFRGTKESLKKLVNEDRVRKHLLIDIWQFYRAERLYLLKVLKEILSCTTNSKHKHHETFSKIFRQLKEKKIKESLIKQLCSSIGCKYEYEQEGSLGKQAIVPDSTASNSLQLQFKNELGKAWVHFALREQVELLQLLLLYFNVADSATERSYDGKDVKLLISIFQQHSFGKRQTFIGNGPAALIQTADIIAPELAEAVGQVESLIVLYLFDLTSLAEEENETSKGRVNSLWYSRSNAPAQGSSLNKDDAHEEIKHLDAAISSLGNLSEHAPIMLAWMLAHYLVEGEESLVTHRSLGERAVHLNVIGFLLTSLQNETASGSKSSLVARITHSTVYSLLSILTTAFNPEQMGAKEDYHNLVCTVLKQDTIASDFWQQGFDSGLGMYLATCLSKFPAIRRETLEISCALASSGKESANQVLTMFSERLTLFAEPVEDVPGHQLQLLNSNTSTNLNSNCWNFIGKSRYPRARLSGGIDNTTVVIPSGTKATCDGRFYQWHLGSYDGLKYLFGEVDVAVAAVSTGINNLSESKLEELVIFTKLTENLLRHYSHASTENTSKSVHQLERLVANSAFALIDKFSQVQRPPINLLANCVRSLSIFSQRTHRPQSVWEKLSETGIFPHLKLTHSSMGEKMLHGYQDKTFDAMKDVDINYGLVGAVLAQQECVQGLYPLTSAFMELLLVCLKAGNRYGSSATSSSQEERTQLQPLIASILYTIRDIFPSFQQWGFSVPGDREKFGQKILQIYLEVMNHSYDDPEDSIHILSKSMQNTIINSLLASAPNQTLLGIVATGDKVIQSLFESQANAESGVGCELSRLVNLSIKVLDAIIRIFSSTTDEDSRLGIETIIGGAPKGNKPHLLLTIANYIHHLQSCDLPRSAVNLLSTIASLFPMSMLACFGAEAQALRDIFLRRLESKTEDILLKISIVKFFTSAVESQPGLIQLLLGVKDIGIVNVNAYVKNPGEKQALTSSEEASNESIALLEDNGCLRTILNTLGEMKNVDGSSALTDSLHVAVVDFLYNLWSHQRILAVAHLKKQDDFWKDLTSPLFDKTSLIVRKTRLNGCILRIIASEVYTYRGNIDQPLKDILEKFFDEKSDYLQDWCDLVINRLLEDGDTNNDESITDESSSIGPTDSREENAVFLLGSWKRLLVVLSRDQPIVVRPKQCNLVVTCLVHSISHHLKSAPCRKNLGNSSYLRVTTSLAETCLILMRRWQTKCADNMELFCIEQGRLLEEVSRCQSGLHPRFVSAIIAFVTTALKFSQFKFKEVPRAARGTSSDTGSKDANSTVKSDAASKIEEHVLLTWLSPVVHIAQQTINIIIDNLLAGNRAQPKAQKLSSDAEHENHNHIEILIISLLRSLIVRLNVASEVRSTENSICTLLSLKSPWFQAVHEAALIQTILSGVHHSIRFRQRPDIIHANLSLLLTIARSEVGCNALLSNDLPQLIWLPLSSIKQGAPKEWIPVFVESLHLVTTLLRVGRQQALENAISFVALLQDQVLSFLSSKGSTTSNDYSIGVEFFLKENQIKLTSATASLVSLMIGYFKQWQLKHPTSLNNTYQSMCSLLHTSVCLLIRPSVLKMLIDQNNRNQDQNQGIGTGASMENAAAEIQKARRRLSSKGATTNEDSYLCLDNGNNSGEPISLIGYVQNKLLEIVGSCLKMLSFLSPDLVALLTDDLVDHSSYIELLQMGFSSPTFEQDEIGALTYGTIVSISNLCIKNLARIPQQPNERSPSPPTKSASASSPEATTTGNIAYQPINILE